MSDIINILPDNIANQIAAGEVIQRPASVVKELIENSVDANATSIKLILKESGKTLIQVIDNGTGMSVTDARVCFERHATSKILESNDLFSIRTKGFRGEAMAAIASISQVDLKTKDQGSIIGTEVNIEGGKFIEQKENACIQGTNTAVKNLFYNTPARRKFLKSNPVELKHCINEFQRVALAHPHIEMKLYNNDDDIYNLPKSNLKQRIVHVLGKNYAQFLIPIQAETDVVNIDGFLIKPEQAKKSRGEQYFFVNDRFIKNPYLNHAIASAYQEIMPKEYHPGYIIYLEMDPAAIDINIHPTKTEIKFEDEKTIYAILKSSVKKSIAQYGVTPSLDFDQETSFNVPVFDKRKEVVEPKISSNAAFNPFQTGMEKTPLEKRQETNLEQWQELYVIEESETEGQEQQSQVQFEEKEGNIEQRSIFQIYRKYVVSQIKSGLVIIHMQRAHERILFDKFLKRLENQARVTQQLLFPENIDLKPDQFSILQEYKDKLRALGFDFEEFGKNSYIFRGLPTDLNANGLQGFIESMLEKLGSNIPESEVNEQLLISMVKKSCIQTGTELKLEEMEELIDQLFASTNPEFSPENKKIIHILPKSDLDNYFIK